MPQRKRTIKVWSTTHQDQEIEISSKATTWGDFIAEHPEYNLPDMDVYDKDTRTIINTPSGGAILPTGDFHIAMFPRKHKGATAVITIKSDVDAKYEEILRQAIENMFDNGMIAAQMGEVMGEELTGDVEVTADSVECAHCDEFNNFIRENQR